VRFTRLEIQNLRNLQRVQLHLAPGLNYFYGENGAGKTALLEAVHVLCRGRSFRTRRSNSLIRNGEEALVVRGVGEDELAGQVSMAVRKDRSARTELRLNGVEARRFSEIARLTPLQVMLPDIAELVFGEPAGRRSWLDWGTFHVKPGYLELQRRYLRAVRQRNVLLRDDASQAVRAGWDRKVADLGEEVNSLRMAYLKAVGPWFERILQELAPELAAGLSLNYRRGWGRDQSLEKLLGHAAGGEVKYTSTMWGPHRADLQLRIDGVGAAGLLSRGQGKMVASALQIAQAALLADSEQRTTLFLMDDAGAELDHVHNERLFGQLERIGGQILATTTVLPGAAGSLARIAREHLHDAENGLSCRVFHVERGQCEESE
jgi:DNA replication and repair protein RecF